MNRRRKFLVALLALVALGILACNGRVAPRQVSSSPFASPPPAVVNSSFPGVATAPTAGSLGVGIRLLTTTANPLQGALVQLQDANTGLLTPLHTTDASGVAFFAQSGAASDFYGFELSSGSLVNALDGVPSGTNATFRVIVTTTYGPLVATGPTGQTFSVSGGSPDVLLTYTVP